MFKLLALCVVFCVGGVVGQFFSIGQFSNKAESLADGENKGTGGDFGPTFTFNVDSVISNGAVEGPTGSGAIYLAGGTNAATQGANDQASRGATNSSMSLINNFFATRGSGVTFSEGTSNPRVYPDNADFGEGSTSQFSTQTILGSLGLNPETPSALSTGSFNATAERDGLGASRSYGLSSTDSVTVDSIEKTGTKADAIGGTDAISIAFNSSTIAAGTTFSETDTDSASAGCQMGSAAVGATSDYQEDSVASKSGCQVSAELQAFDK
eukprot:TRINITY_DN1162_c0_g2_i1.p1 TRINITY_DN1162_c0_g2~~TRINITY_DN1162_c0_g2_i1.p1  ORF type:complete len:301 (+),score=44.27 TRINITY_DN1162_c0_g2_i1:101-904(+)